MTLSPHLFVVYDGNCNFCQKIMKWMRAKDTFRNCDFIPYQTSNLRARWPQISRKNARHGLQAVLLDGEVIKNETAVAACLMQLKGYRWLARIIISPFIQPMASSIYRLIASKRR